MGLEVLAKVRRRDGETAPARSSAEPLHTEPHKCAGRLPQGVTLSAPPPPVQAPLVVVPPLPKQRASSVGTFTRPPLAAASSQALSAAPPPSRKSSVSPRRGFSGPHKPPVSLEEQQALRSSQAVATPDRGAASRQKARRRAEVYAMNALLELNEAETASARV